MKKILTAFLISMSVVLTAFSPANAGPSKQYDLLKAVKDQNLAELRTLLKEGVSPDTRTYSDGIPALVLAARTGNLQIMEELLKAGARPDISTRDRRETALMIRAMSRNSSLVTLLIKHKAKLDVTDKANESALIKAVRGRQYTNAKILVDAGADTSIQDLTGKTAMDYARINRARRIVTLLETAGAE